MRDIASWIVEAATLTGRDAALVDDRLPAADGSINLAVAPHELFELDDAPSDELQRAAMASVCICTEQPGTPWFGLTLDAARLGLMSFDINAHGVDALRDARVNAHRLQLGAVPSMKAPAAERDLDVVFLGGLDARRGEVLATLAPRLYERNVELHLFKFDRPVGLDAPGLVFGAEKYALLRRAKVLLNIHRGGGSAGYFEWARMVETMANGALVLTEPSTGAAPLTAGRHFVEADADRLADELDRLLTDDTSRASIADSALAEVTGPLALSIAVDVMCAQIEREVLPHLTAHTRRRIPRTTKWRLGASRVPPPVRLTAFKPYTDLHRRAKRLAMAENDALRALDHTACLLAHGAPQHIERIVTPAYDGATPEVTVAVSVYNYADVVAETLASIVASEGIDFEVVVVEDHATDDSRGVVRRFLDEHPDVPVLLLAKDANEGLSEARNTAFTAARAGKVMVIDADNHLYPTALRRLADALDADPGADAAYSILEDFGAARDVRSALAWDVERLCRGNYVDAQAMLRRDAWQALGGYRPDEDGVHGWEDWDLWLRMAANGRRATLVPQILGRYRVQQGSMVALTNLAADDAIAVMRRRYPTLPWPLPPAGCPGADMPRR